MFTCGRAVDVQLDKNGVYQPYRRLVDNATTQLSALCVLMTPRKSCSADPGPRSPDLIPKNGNDGRHRRAGVGVAANEQLYDMPSRVAGHILYRPYTYMYFLVVGVRCFRMASTGSRRFVNMLILARLEGTPNVELYVNGMILSCNHQPGECGSHRKGGVLAWDHQWERFSDLTTDSR